MIIIALLAAIWIVSAVITYTAAMAFWERKWGDREMGRFFGITYGLFGPLGILMVALSSNGFYYGFKF